MKLYVLIEEFGCYTDYQSTIKHVTNKKKDVLKIANELIETFNFSKHENYIQAVYIDVWEDGKQLEDKTIKLY